MNSQRHRQILRIALPSIVSNITVPLLGMVDVAIVGHMGGAAYIGAVAVGSMVFNLIYWLFAFLRMGTSGMTAQGLGRRDMRSVGLALMRSLAVAMGIALLLIALQVPLRWTAFTVISPTADVLPLATTYFSIVIWGSPAVLGLYSLSGWFVGMQNTRIPMYVSIFQNLVNIAASLILVYAAGMKTEGVALGTVIAQYAGLLLAAALLQRYYSRLFPYFSTDHVLSNLGDFLRVNRDIFLRTLCLVAVNLWFTTVGARQGAVVLSANTVLLQLYLFFSYFMDGFAYAGEALCGRHYGARNPQAMRETLRHLFLWMTIVTTVFTLLYIIGGTSIVGMLTDEPDVRETTRRYIAWAWAVPAAGCLAFIWDGVFIGITETRGMLLSSVASAAIFFTTYILFLPYPEVANHALWLSQIAYLMARGVLQTIWYTKKIEPKLRVMQTANQHSRANERLKGEKVVKLS